MRASLVVSAIAILTASLNVDAAENALSDSEKSAGWKLLFNGKDLTGWKCSNGKPVATPGNATARPRGRAVSN